MREHVGQADVGGLAGDVVGVVALDDRGDGLGQAPPAGEDAADQRVVDAELTALAVDALLRGAGTLVDLGRIARVRMHQDELADVVQKRGDHQAVALLVAGLGGETVGRALRRDAVEAEALGSTLPDGGALEEVVGPGARGERLDGLGREELDRLDHALDAATGAALDLVGQTQDGDDQGAVGLDGRDDLGGRHPLLRHEAQQPVARLGQGRERLERLEGSRQTTTMAFVVPALGTDGGLRGRVLADRVGRRGHPCFLFRGRHRYRHVWTHG